MDTGTKDNGQQMLEIIDNHNQLGIKFILSAITSLENKLGILIYTAAGHLDNIRKELNKVGCNYSYEEFLELIKEVHVKNEASIKEFKSLCNGKEK